MSTSIRPEVSKKNKYWIERHRYYELKHFCLQYLLWKKAYSMLDGISKTTNDVATSKTNTYSSPTEKCAIEKLYYSERMEMIEKAAKETDESLSSYILRGVTEGVSYDYLKARLNIPCCKDTYYELYRRFFWILSKMRK